MDIVTGLKTQQPVLSEDWEDKAYKASLHFCVFKRDVHSPMTDASLARLFFQHIPEALELDRLGQESSPCQARFLARRIEQDMVVGRDYDQWLSGYNHLKPETRDLFAHGKQNSFNVMLDRLADIGGYEREDILIREAEQDVKEAIQKRISSVGKATQENIAAMRSFGMNDNGF